MDTLEDTMARLAEISRLLDEATEDLGDMDHAAVRAKIAYLRAYNSALLAAEGAVDIKRAKAELDALDEIQHKELCESNVRIGKERLRTLRDQMEILRTTAAGQRVQFMAEPTGQWT